MNLLQLLLPCWLSNGASFGSELCSGNLVVKYVPSYKLRVHSGLKTLTAVCLGSLSVPLAHENLGSVFVVRSHCHIQVNRYDLLGGFCSDTNGRMKGKITVFHQVESIELPMDNKTNKRRGFCFITFKEEEPVKKIMEKKYHNVGLSKVGGFFFLEKLNCDSRGNYIISCICLGTIVCQYL